MAGRFSMYVTICSSSPTVMEGILLTARKGLLDELGSVLACWLQPTATRNWKPTCIYQMRVSKYNRSSKLTFLPGSRAQVLNKSAVLFTAVIS